MLITGGILFYVQRASLSALVSEQQAVVAAMRDDMVAGFKEGGRADLIDLINARLSAVQPDIPALLLVSPTGQRLAGNLGAWPPVIAPQTAWRTIDLYRTGSSRPEHMAVIATVLPDGSRLLTGHVINGNVRLRQINEDAMIAALLLAVPLALMAALVAGRLLGNRLAGIASAANAVARGQLSERVLLTGSNDAFDRLGATINAMLARIETLIAELRVVTDSLAHDLRSPITRLKSTLERAILETGDADALSALTKVSTEADALLAMLTTALEISRAEAGIGRDRFVDTDASQLLADLTEVYGPYAEDLGFILTTTAPNDLKIAVHRKLVSQALGNLIENATKYAGGAKSIAICAHEVADGVSFEVADDGPGIAPDQRSIAVRRFGRLDPARQVAGSGLGLALVEAVARLHGGSMTLSDNEPGLRVSLLIKRMDQTAF